MKILEAAIRHDPTNSIITGKNHCKCMCKWKELFPDMIGELKTRNIEEGFVTEDCRFVNRDIAAKIALESKQIEKLHYSSHELYSEDLYYDEIHK